MFVPQGLKEMDVPRDGRGVCWRDTELQRRLKLAAMVGIPRRVRCWDMAQFCLCPALFLACCAANMCPQPCTTPALQCPIDQATDLYKLIKVPKLSIGLLTKYVRRAKPACMPAWSSKSLRDFLIL